MGCGAGSEKMITVFLRGGLGNQMFQYALGLHLARRNNTGLQIDTVFLNDRLPRSQFTYRTYDLDIFDIKPKFTALSKISGTISFPGLWLGLDLGLMGAQDVFGFRKMVIEDEREGYVFDPNVLQAGSNVLLYGRWASEKYFREIADEVQSAFRFSRPLGGEAKKLAVKIDACNSISLHVRRGDYLLPKYAKTYGSTDLAYYERAVHYMLAHVPDARLFVISDDPAWSAENLKFSIPATYLDYASAGPKNIFHMELMSRCKHHIIMNSSFSWWGAWLNRNPGKIVVAPKIWDIGKDSSDATPESWARL